MISLILFCLIYYFIGGVVVVLGYHRGLTHRAFKMKKWLERVFVCFAIPAGTPIQWVGTHRYHHIHADQKDDPHAPQIHGFWYAHNGWYINSYNVIICFLYAIAGPIRIIVDAYLRPITNQEYNYLAKDVSRISFYTKVSKPFNYRLIMGLHLILPYVFVYYFWAQTGILVLWLTQIIVYNLGDSINSLGHEHDGEDDHDEVVSSNKANNRPLWALLTFGAAYHANHHNNPSVARLDTNENGIDLAWVILVVLEQLNLVSNIKRIK